MKKSDIARQNKEPYVYCSVFRIDALSIGRYWRKKKEGERLGHYIWKPKLNTINLSLTFQKHNRQHFTLQMQPSRLAFYVTNVALQKQNPFVFFRTNFFCSIAE